MTEEIIQALNDLGPITVSTALENEFRRRKFALEGTIQNYNFNDCNWRMLPDELKEWEEEHSKLMLIVDALEAINPEWEAVYVTESLECDIPF